MALAGAGIHSLSLQVAGVSATVAEGHPRSSTEMCHYWLRGLLQRTVAVGCSKKVVH